MLIVISKGQHLITALADTMDLGRQRSSMELDTATVKPGEMEALEAAVNEKIRAHIPVAVNLLSVDDPAVEKACVHLQKSSFSFF
uniref:Uncharacterized protein n=1 Tax=Sinocyclocheilus grahami TaxID=75366 RepID=A0A672R5Q1_SINGR